LSRAAARLWLVYPAQMAVLDLENSVGRLALESPDWDWALPAALPGKSPPRALLDPARPHFVNSVRRTVTALPAPRSTGREFSLSTPAIDFKILQPPVLSGSHSATVLAIHRFVGRPREKGK
jgi:hypothetical protein